MTRQIALQKAEACFRSGAFFQRLAQRVACQTESQNPGQGSAMRAYLEGQMQPYLEAMGFECVLHPNPVEGAPPFLVASRIEPDAPFTVLSYGHGDVVRGNAERWRSGLSPWELKAEDGLWYGRGSADNKGQHSINLTALEMVLQTRGRLGFSFRLLLEMGEELGSPGLDEFCRQHRAELASDVFIASDGPRVSRDVATVFLGSRGGLNFELKITARKSGYHSGNWGGLLSNPAIRLSHAIACLVDARGRIRVEALRPSGIPESVRMALQRIEVGTGATDPRIDEDWGEPGLTSAEKVIAWNNLEVLAFEAGNPAAPVNAIPPQARAVCQLRFAPGMDYRIILPAIRSHLDACGFEDVILTQASEDMPASRLDPDNAWVRFVTGSLERSTGKTPDLLPNLGGTLPNYVFADTLGLPTIWIPHSYAACCQHAPDEHVTEAIMHEGLMLMTSLFLDLGELIGVPQ